MAKPRVIYMAKEGSLLEVDKDYYDRLAIETEKRDLVEQFVIPPRSGKAWTVYAGQVCRIVCSRGSPGGRFQCLEPSQPT